MCQECRNSAIKGTLFSAFIRAFIVLLFILLVFRGVKLIYLPPYSPDLNPIEESFSFIKAYIRRHGDRFRAGVASRRKELPFLFLYEALDQISLEHAKGWMKDCGYI
jgi:hypothetical protein